MGQLNSLLEHVDPAARILLEPVFNSLWRGATSLLDALLERFDPAARLLLEILLNSLWQGALIVALVWLLVRVAGRASATTRHALWLVGLLAVALTPFVAAFVQRGNIAAPKPVVQERRAVEPTATLPPAQLADQVAQLPAPRQRVQAAAALNFTTPAPTLAASNSVPAAKENIQSNKTSWLTDLLGGRLPLALAGVWLLVCLTLLGRIARSYLFLFQLRRNLTPVAPELHARMERLELIFGIRRKVRLGTAPQVAMPMTIGFLRPLIILPEDLSATLSEAECDSVLAHELAHIKRWDYLTNFAQRVIQALFFFHPAVWLVGKQLMLERELACDDWAVRLTGEPRRYAGCLAKLVELLNVGKPLAAAAGIIFGKHVISRRIEMILNRDRNANTSLSKPALLCAVGMACLFVLVCSRLAPVIAVPLAQKRAPQAKPAVPAKPATPATPATAPAVAAVRATLPDMPEPPEPPELPGTPATPPSAIGFVDELDDDELLAPPARATAAPLLTTSLSTPVIAVADQDPVAPLPPVAAVRPAPAPRPVPAPEPFVVTPQAPTVVRRAEENRTPVIPENELLSVLTDIVKKDADPNVRNEALQGIYRMRSDAAINALIQLYDGVADTRTKGEIIGYLIRREGDNSKAVAKLLAIAKNEKDEDLRGRAISRLAYVKGDEGAEHLIQIYDSLQDQKMKQRVIRSLAANKSKKAVDKLIAIAKNDSDPVIRQYAIRSIYGIDSNKYLELLDSSGKRISNLKFDMDIPFVGHLEFQKEWGERQQEMQERWQQQQERMQERMREMQDRWQRQGLDKLNLDEMLDKLRLELPKIELNLKDLELNLQEQHQGVLFRRSLNSGLRAQLASVEQQLESLQARVSTAPNKTTEASKMQNNLAGLLQQVRSLQRRPLIAPRVATTKAATI